MSTVSHVSFIMLEYGGNLAAGVVTDMRKKSAGEANGKGLRQTIVLINKILILLISDDRTDHMG